MYPKTVDGVISFYPVKDPSKDLVKGQFGIPEPEGNGAPVSGEDIDIVIMPGVAFDYEGRRLGYGKGCYDRWLGNIPEKRRPLLIGVCMRFQMMTDIPAESSDIPVDMVLCI